MGDKTEKVDLSGRRGGWGCGVEEGTKEARFTSSREKEEKKKDGY